jgi:hypothetical protein
MKNTLKTILAVAGLALITGKMFASIGDSYQQTCAKWGKPAARAVDGDAFLWSLHGRMANVEFKDDRCVGITF